MTVMRSVHKLFYLNSYKDDDFDCNKLKIVVILEQRLKDLIQLCMIVTVDLFCGCYTRCAQNYVKNVLPPFKQASDYLTLF